MGHSQPRTVSPTEAPVPATTDSAHMREREESSKVPYAVRVPPLSSSLCTHLERSQRRRSSVAQSLALRVLPVFKRRGLHPGECVC